MQNFGAALAYALDASPCDRHRSAGRSDELEVVLCCREHLEELDISWCRGIPAKALGLLADSCPNLAQLQMFGCSQVTPDFLYGHSNESLDVVGCTLQATAEPVPARMDLVMSS